MFNDLTLLLFKKESSVYVVTFKFFFIEIILVNINLHIEFSFQIIQTIYTKVITFFSAGRNHVLLYLKDFSVRCLLVRLHWVKVLFFDDTRKFWKYYFEQTWSGNALWTRIAPSRPIHLDSEKLGARFQFIVLVRINTWVIYVNDSDREVR